MIQTKPILPVNISDMINKVTNPNLSIGERQDYEKSLLNIQDGINSALKTFELHREFKK